MNMLNNKNHVILILTILLFSCKNEETDQYSIDEQIIDTNSEKQNHEKIIQKMNASSVDKNYTIYTDKFDEIAKAEKLETEEEIAKLRKNLDQQLITFQDLITKLANKLQRQLLAKQNRSWNLI